MATMVRAPFMPTRCWIAPEMPSATYSFGATVWPELPIWRSIGSQPLSQIGRDAASSAPSAAASCSASARCSWALMPRPTATMRSACDRSTAALASWNGGSAVWRSAPASMRDGLRGHRRPAAARGGVGAEAPIWNDTQVRRRPLGGHVGDQLALEHRPRERAASPSAARVSPTTSVTSARSSRAASVGAKSRVW